VITFSALPRVEVCPASAALPRDPERPAEYADRGTSRHLFLAAVPELGAEAALALVPEAHRAECAGIDLEGLPLDNVETEVSFAIHLETGRARLLGRNLARQYQLEPGEIAGTVDVLGPWYVGDYKGEHDDTPPPPADNLQLLAGAWAAAEVYGWDTVRVELIHLRADGSHWREAADLDAIALGAAMVRIRKAAARVSPEIVVRSGHCRWCPSFGSCPGTLALARRLVTPEVVEAEAQGLLATQAGHALQLVRVARKVLERVEAEIREVASREPIPLPGGKAYGPGEVRRVKSGAALRVLRERYGEDVEAAARKVSTSMDRIKEALAPVAKDRGVPLAAMVRETEAAIAAADGFDTETEFRDRRAS
jgi:hypothetical protein